MAQYLFSFLTTSLIMSIIILGVLVAIIILPVKFSPRLRYLAWVIILIGLIIPMRPLLGNGLLTIELPSALSSPGQAEVVETNAGILQTTPDFVQDLHQTGQMAAPGNVLHLASIIAIIWATVAFVVFTIHIWKYVRFSKLIRRWGEAVHDAVIIETFDAIKKDKGIKRNIELKKCSFVSTSMLVGFIRPVVLLPDKEFDADELELIFRHELIHYKRGDLYVKLLSVIAASLHWFNPAMYFMSYAMQADCEASCDEKVLLEAGSDNNRFYAELIMDMIGAHKSHSTLLSTCFYGGKRGIKIRMDAIMNGASAVTKFSFSSLLALFLTLTLLSGSVFAFSYYIPQDTQTHTSYYDFDELDLQITAMQAREIALLEVGGGILAGLFFDHLLDVFRIEVLYNANRFYLGINARDGSVMIYRMEEVTMQNITWVQAMEIALGTVDNSRLIFGGMEIIDGFQIFMFHIEADGRNFEIMIGPAGQVLVNEYSE